MMTLLASLFVFNHNSPKAAASQRIFVELKIERALHVRIGFTAIGLRFLK
jgi:hypothetical protein